MKREKIIIISGASTVNNGAEAMLLEIVELVKQMFPEHRVVILSDIMFAIDGKNKVDINYEVLPENLLCIGEMDSFSVFMLKKGWIQFADRKIIARLKQADYWFDINGFKLGQQWGKKAMLRYLYRIHTARKYNIRICILPQSFGPFDKLRGIYNLPFHLIMRKELKYPTLIMAREKDGKKVLNRYTKKNVILFRDMVLCSQNKADSSLLYKKPPEEKLYHVQEEAVALIPNEKIATYGVNWKGAMAIYKAVIDTIRRQGRKKVWVIPHCDEDIPICCAIKRLYENDKAVVLIREKLSICEYRRLIKQFSYAVISRFHGGVHALKEDVLCIFIGWAVKYQVLASEVGLDEFVIDVHSWGNGEAFEAAVLKMEKEKNALQDVVKNRIKKIEEECNLRELLQMHLQSNKQDSETNA